MKFQSNKDTVRENRRQIFNFVDLCTFAFVLTVRGRLEIGTGYPDPVPKFITRFKIRGLYVRMFICLQIDFR